MAAANLPLGVAGWEGGWAPRSQEGGGAWARAGTSLKSDLRKLHAPVAAVCGVEGRARGPPPPAVPLVRQLSPAGGEADGAAPCGASHGSGGEIPRPEGQAVLPQHQQHAPKRPARQVAVTGAPFHERYQLLPLDPIGRGAAGSARLCVVKGALSAEQSIPVVRPADVHGQQGQGASLLPTQQPVADFAHDQVRVLKTFSSTSKRDAELAAYAALPAHPHVLKCEAAVQVGVPDEAAVKPGIVLQWAPWGDLVSFITAFNNLYAPSPRLETALPEMVVAFILAQLLAALGHMHRFGWAHRDVKTDNVLVSSLVLAWEGTVRFLRDPATGAFRVANPILVLQPPQPGAANPYAVLQAHVQAAQLIWRGGADGGLGRLLVLPYVVVNDFDKAIQINPLTGLMLPASGAAPSGATHASCLEIGTAQYTAPEVWMRKQLPGPYPEWARVDARSVDCFAAGVVTWALLRAALPFQHAGLMNQPDEPEFQRIVGEQILRWDIQAGMELPECTSDAAVAIVSGLLQHDVSQRLSPIRALYKSQLIDVLAARSLPLAQPPASSAAPVVLMPAEVA